MWEAVRREACLPLTVGLHRPLAKIGAVTHDLTGLSTQFATTSMASTSFKSREDDKRKVVERSNQRINAGLTMWLLIGSCNK